MCRKPYTAKNKSPDRTQTRPSHTNGKASRVYSKCVLFVFQIVEADVSRRVEPPIALVGAVEREIKVGNCAQRRQIDGCPSVADKGFTVAEIGQIKVDAVGARVAVLADDGYFEPIAVGTGFGNGIALFQRPIGVGRVVQADAFWRHGFVELDARILRTPRAVVQHGKLFGIVGTTVGINAVLILIAARLFVRVRREIKATITIAVVVKAVEYIVIHKERTINGFAARKVGAVPIAGGVQSHVFESNDCCVVNRIVTLFAGNEGAAKAAKQMKCNFFIMF